METGIIASSLVFLLLGIFIVLFLLFHITKQKKNKDEKVKIQAEYIQTLLQSQIEIQEQTLKNISEEIHDNIGQVLSLAKFNLGTVDFNRSHDLESKIEDSKQLVAKAIQDLRDLSRSLHTDYIQQRGLLRAIEYELELLGRAGRHKTQLSIQGAVYSIDPQKELILFRIVQEVLANAIKHANATVIMVSLHYQQNAFRLTISDNGTGFNASIIELNGSTVTNAGLGIKNMRNRAKLIGAEYSLTSIVGEGTTVQLILPLTSNIADHAPVN